MSEPTRYEIRTVMDFLSVPEEKRDACLADFELWLAAQDFMAALLKDMIETGQAAPQPVFTWIDDGQHNMNLRLVPMEPPA